MRYSASSVGLAAVARLFWDPACRRQVRDIRWLMIGVDPEANLCQNSRGLAADGEVTDLSGDRGVGRNAFVDLME